MVKLPDKESLEGFTKKVSEAVKLPGEPEKSGNGNGLTDKELEKIHEEERKKIEKEQKDKDSAEKAKKYEEIEAQKRAEDEKLLAEKKKQQEMERLEKEKLAEDLKKQKEKDTWAGEEDKKRKEEERKKTEIERDLLRKQKEEKKAAGPQNHTLRNILIIVVIILAVLTAGYISLITGNDNINAYGYPLSYAAQYDILMPDNTEVSFAGIPVRAISSGGSATLIINNDRNTMSIGQTATYPAKHLTVKSLGITFFDGDYQVTATYRGVVTNKDDFLTVIKTSKPIPSWLVSLMKPSGVEIRPV